jgi:hypothetical protein
MILMPTSINYNIVQSIKNWLWVILLSFIISAPFLLSFRHVLWQTMIFYESSCDYAFNNIVINVGFFRITLVIPKKTSPIILKTLAN